MESHDLAVIGAGPGGYVAAIRAAQLGMKVAIVEKAPRLGGTCLNVGCIPSKVLLESTELFANIRDHAKDHGIGVAAPTMDVGAMIARKDKIVREIVDGVGMLMKKNKITVVQGRARFASREKLAVEGPTGTVELPAKSFLIATGSAPVELPFLKFDGDRVVSSTEALAFGSVPKHLVVIGGGAVGLELGSVWMRLGAKVTVVEMLPQITPFADALMARTLAQSLKKQGMDLRTGTKLAAAKVAGGQVTLTVEGADGKSEQLVCDKVLVAVGRRPVTDGLGLADVGVAVEKNGRIKIDSGWRTSAENIFAIGDVVEGPMLAHKASEEGVAVVERIAGQPGHVNYEAIPSIVYTWPELAQVGMTEEQAKAKGLEIKVGRNYFKPNGRAKSMNEEEGLVKVIADAKTDRLLGVHIVGARASDMIAEAAIAMELKASCEDLARAVHAHPTLAEILKEAAMAADRRAIHG